MMAMQNSRISYFGNIAHLKKAIHTHRESDPLCDSDALDEIEIISNVLNTWQMYKPDQFYELMKQQGPNMALLFNNIDGVSSNFESFSAELDLLEISFAAICLAETNLHTDQGNLYHPPGYKPVLQS